MLKLHGLLALLLLLSPALFANSKARNTLKKICQQQGLLDVNSKQSLSFQFNVVLPNKKVTRNWQWHIQKNQIVLEGEPSKDSSKFVNDIYWLLYPLMVYQDPKGTELVMNEGVLSPVGQTKSREIVVKHTGEKGYTPGDTYKLYVNDAFQIIEWSYYPAGAKQPKLKTTWENYHSTNGLTLSLIRKGEGGFVVEFKNIDVQ